MEVIFWFIFCGVVAYYANKRGRNAIGWGLGALIFSPLLAGIALAIMKDMSVNETISEIKMDQAQLKDRVATNEKITEMKFNKINNEMNALTNGTGEPRNQLYATQNTMQLTQAVVKLCPFCGQEIKRDAIKCKHCEKILTDIKECPYCKETIHKDAIKCKHCKSDLPQPPQEEGNIQVVEG